MRETKWNAESEIARADAGRIAALMKRKPGLIRLVFGGLSSESARVRFGCSKSLLLLSGSHPELLRPRKGSVYRLLDSENQILKWNAIAVFGNIAAAGIVQPSLQKLSALLTNGELITANHAIAALGKIARAFPGKQRQITSRLLKIEGAPFKTRECGNIAIGKCIEAMGTYLRPGQVPQAVLEFVRRQAGNGRKSTAAKASAFLRKFSSGNSASRRKSPGTRAARTGGSLRRSGPLSSGA